MFAFETLVRPSLEPETFDLHRQRTAFVKMRHQAWYLLLLHPRGYGLTLKWRFQSQRAYHDGTVCTGMILDMKIAGTAIATILN